MGRLIHKSKERKSCPKKVMNHIPNVKHTQIASVRMYKVIKVKYDHAYLELTLSTSTLLVISLKEMKLGV